MRLSAGRDRMSRELQVLCFLAGANSIFFGDKLLTAPNPDADEDAALFRAMGLSAFPEVGCVESRTYRTLIGPQHSVRTRSGGFRRLHPPYASKSMSLTGRWQTMLDELRAQGRYRRLRRPPASISRRTTISVTAARPLPEAVRAIAAAARRRACCAGIMPLWDDVEAKLAMWHGAEAALVITSGYVANEGLLSTSSSPAIGSRPTRPITPRSSTACDLPKAERFVFRHNDLNHLESGLRGVHERRANQRQLFIVVESLFGMEGDVAPLVEIAALGGAYHAQIDRR